LTHIRDVAATKKIQSQTPAHLHTLKRGVSNCILFTIAALTILAAAAWLVAERYNAEWQFNVP